MLEIDVDCAALAEEASARGQGPTMTVVYVVRDGSELDRDGVLQLVVCCLALGRSPGGAGEVEDWRG